MNKGYLDQITKGQWLDGGNLGTLSTRSLYKVSSLGQFRSTLEVDLGTRLASIFLGCFVVLDALKNLLLTLRRSDMLNSYVNTLFEDATIHKLVDTDTHGRLGNIKDNSRSSVVSLVWHTLVYAGVSEDVNVVTDLDIHQVLGKMNGTMLAAEERERQFLRDGEE